MIEPFGTTASGQPVQRLTLKAGDLTVRLLTLGGILQDVRLAGTPFSLTLGSDRLAAYEGPFGYCGALVGPVANRIAGARMPFDGRDLTLIANEHGRTTLHGGPLGLHARVWTLDSIGDGHARLSLTLPDGAEGYPGNRRLRAQYRLAAPTLLELTIEAETDAPTPINIANHSYWVLGPDGLAGHRLEIAADRYTPVDADLIPTGATPSVEGSDFDFRQPRAIGPEATARYDHNFCLAPARRTLSFAARLTGPTGLALTLETTEPGLQVYDAAKLSTAPFPGHGGTPLGAFAGVALEAQGWPDAPHHAGFPPVRLDPGETYRQLTRWTFTG